MRSNPKTAWKDAFVVREMPCPLKPGGDIYTGQETSSQGLDHIHYVSIATFNLLFPGKTIRNPPLPQDFSDSF